MTKELKATKVGVETTALLIKREDLQSYLEQIKTTQQQIVDDLEKIIPYAQNESLKESLQRRLDQGKQLLVGLNQGFVPVSSGDFLRTDPKTKWQKRWVKQL